ncbi:MAG: flippase-like domain-containing protein [Prolixibacteraceae bacterium]|nr:flippase-like domain-containing protein [Prolixibacteraceae bacterium]MBN2773833.1 flippase-like domain-containing protein [Prolixibacteraceae bacterium]
MKKKILNVLKFIAFFSVGGIIFWLIYKDQDIARIKEILTNDVNYTWIWLSLFLGLLSHISRSIRWNLMIEPLSHKPRLLNTFLSVMIGYLMNLVLPRMGEISRCGVLSRYEKISFPKLVGTVVTERIIDVIMLLLFFVFVLFTQFGQFLGFLHRNPEIEHNVRSLITSPVLWGGLVIFIAMIIVYRRTLKNTILFKKIDETLALFKEGLISVRNMKKKWAFIGHSFFIWIMYYLMMYVVFFSFDFTRDLTPLAGLTTFVLASFGMVAPSPGGIGSWHFMTKEALWIYGIDKGDGLIFAFLMHTTMTSMLIVIGLISFLILPFLNRRNVTAKS